LFEIIKKFQTKYTLTLWRSWDHAKQLRVLLLNRFVALAGTLAQTINVEYFNFAARAST
jgi:hypothetical protein